MISSASLQKPSNVKLNTLSAPVSPTRGSVADQKFGQAGPAQQEKKGSWEELFQNMPQGAAVAALPDQAEKPAPPQGPPPENDPFAHLVMETWEDPGVI